MPEDERPEGQSPRLSDDEYQTTQDQIFMLAEFADTLPLDAFRSRLEHADAVGSILDPTLYRQALQSGKLDAVREVAEAAHDFQKAFRKARDRIAERERRLGGKEPAVHE